MTAAFIRRLTLTNFRSYHAAQILLERAGPVVLTGANGAGKTNLIEAISLLAPGRGLRRATMEELAFSEGDGGWATSAEIEGMLGLATLGTGIDPPAGDESEDSPAREGEGQDRPEPGAGEGRPRRGEPVADQPPGEPSGPGGNEPDTDQRDDRRDPEAAAHPLEPDHARQDADEDRRAP